MTIVVLDTDFPDLDVERPIADRAGIDIVLNPPVIPEGTTALMTMWSPVDEPRMAALPALRVVGRLGLGVDMIDVEAATKRDIAVVNSGNYATEEVSSHAVALILALVRQIVNHDRVVRDGGWLDRAALDRMRRLSEMTIGIVGLGRIGCRTGALLAALGTTVIGFDPNDTPCSVQQADSLAELLHAVDVVSLHVPLGPGTSGLIGRPEFSAMRPGALLVNTARGGLVDEEALIEALASGRLGGAALDVFATEPLDDSPLAGLPNVVLTPHVAYFSPSALLDARQRTMRGIVAVLAGERPENQIN